jgi:glycosyltransferase involved in cell wall biosynthesis
MSSEFTFYVLTSAYDHQEKYSLEHIQPDRWCNWEDRASVYYLSDRRTTSSDIYKILKQIQPDFIYINGLFSPVYNIKALIAAKRFAKKIHAVSIILSPRGMLHTGALSQKRIKKNIFLKLFSLGGLYKNITWHASDEKEVHFIRNKFKKSKINVAANFPKVSAVLYAPEKEKGALIMGTLALISPMKNYIEILHALKHVNENIVWHIFGPVKDAAYWKRCNEVMKQLPANIQVIYHGAIPPDRVSSALEKIQVFILPSKSENFGHAIFEALSAGKPVITTQTTPFTNLQHKNAGYSLSIHNLQPQLIQAIHDFAELDSEIFSQYQNNAIQYASGFINVEKLKSQYRAMFSNA